MLVVESVTDLQKHMASWRREGQSVALVPTMGNLHAGHLALIGAARAKSQRVVASIFVNPKQFGPNEDLAAYPRTLEADQDQCRRHDTDVLFVPAVHTVYPNGVEGSTYVEVPGISDVLCGAFRPGHFRGVTTVVSILLNAVRPDVLIMGEKDYQQLLIIRRMVHELCYPVEVVGVPTVRETDGLAMSSRNQYLGPDARRKAAWLYKALNALAGDVKIHPSDYKALEQQTAGKLTELGFEVDYVSVRDEFTLGEPEPGRPMRALAAVRLDGCRLIDNIACY